MKKTEFIKIRITKELKDYLKTKDNFSAYLTNLIEEERINNYDYKKRS